MAFLPTTCQVVWTKSLNWALFTKVRGYHLTILQSNPRAWGVISPAIVNLLCFLRAFLKLAPGKKNQMRQKTPSSPSFAGSHLSKCILPAEPLQRFYIETHNIKNQFCVNMHSMMSQQRVEERECPLLWSSGMSLRTRITRSFAFVVGVSFCKSSMWSLQRIAKCSCLYNDHCCCYFDFSEHALPLVFVYLLMDQ